MGTDLLKAKYKKDELRKKYKNYFVPAAKIEIGDSGNNLADHFHVQIENIRISMNRKDAASASFTVTNIYNLEERSIKSSVKTALALGSTVKISLGYESSLEEVFYGFIYESTIQFGDMPSMQITAMDARRLMLDNFRTNYAWSKTSHSEIFEEITGDYKKLIQNKEIEKSSIELTEPLVQNGNDFDMIRQLCEAVNKQFFVCGSKAYFIEKTEAAPITTLLWGQELFSFSQTPCYADTQIEVWGNLKGSSQMQVEKRKVTAGGSMKYANQNSAAKIITLTDIDSVKELAERADREQKSLEERIHAGSGSCMGTPELIPGRCVNIEGLSDDIDGTYYLESVNHSFGSDGFTTDFTLGNREADFYGAVLEKEKEEENHSQKAEGIALGKVIKNWDSDHPGMVEVEFLLGEQGKNNIGWVPVAVPYAGSGFGTYMLPEENSQVLIGFHMGQIKSPYVIGCPWNQTNALPEETADEKNTKKTILTKGGNRIVISDEEGKERITIKTKGELLLELDDENQKISMQDKEGENAVSLQAKEGILSFSAKKKVLFQVDGKEMLCLNKEGTTASVNADSISIEAGQKLELKGQNTTLEGSSTDCKGQNIKLEAQASLELKGSASLKAESSGITEVKGSMLKLN